MHLRLMAVRNGFVSIVPEPMCGPGGVADDVSLTSQMVCRENTNRLSLRRTEVGIGSSSFSGGEERKPRDQEEKLKKLRAQVELLTKQQRMEKVLETQGESTRRDSGLEEDC